MQKMDALIRTKLHLPFTRPALVPRPRLQQQIMEGLRAPLTLVTAPAGFGKTTLVASCAAACGMPVAWLSLDKNDNQAGRFLTYLIAALQTVRPQIGVEAAQILEGIQQANPEVVLTHLINDLDRIHTEIALVLDDYQWINSQAVHDEVAFLLEHSPKSFHLVIATRSDPPIPLSRLRARGLVVELRSADLRFTSSEAARFLNDVMGLRLNEGMVALLEERTEGWIVGLQMAAVSMRDRKDVMGFIEGFSGTNRYILDYLLEEVLARQSPEIQHFLLHTSILERLTAPLCDALLENTEPVDHDDGSPWVELSSLQKYASILEYLERENLFLVSLDDERIWFRYHYLFADLLKARLQHAKPDRAPFLHTQAAAWLEQNGFIPEAIQHLFAAREDNQAADLIERYGPEYWIESDPSIVQMADNLPPETLVTRPKIGLYRVWLLIMQGSIRKALSLLDSLEQQLAGENPDTGQRWVQTFITLAQVFLIPRRDISGYVPLPDYQALDEIPGDDLILRDAADMLYAMTLGRCNELNRAIEISIKNTQRQRIPRETPVIPYLVPFLARVYWIQGRLHAAASLSRQYIDLMVKRGVRFICSGGDMNIVLGEALYEWNCLEESEQQIRDGLQANEPWLNVMSDAFGLLALTRVLCAKGDYPAAIRLVDTFEIRMQGHLRPTEFQEDFRTLRARVYLAFGNIQEASEWADRVQLGEDYRLNEKYYRLTLAHIRLAQGRYAEVEKLLAGAAPEIEAGNQISRQIETNLFLAVAVAGQGRLPEALRLIESCLALAEPEGYIRIFLDMGEMARELLSAYLESDFPDHKPYARKVLDAFSPLKKENLPGLQAVGLVEPLSERELEVLHLMAQGNTNQEIAVQLVVARGTIKAHAASIYRKLDASNRTEAVARARELGILP